MAETKPSDQGEQHLRSQEVKPLASSDAQSVLTPSAQDKQIAEADRTNQSSGSLTELALKTRGLTKEQIAAQMEAQGDSISIDYGDGQKASRKTGLTEKALVQVGSKAYDAKTVVAYEPQTNSGIVSDATNATAVYETDKSKIVPKQVDVQPMQVNAGLDYNKENVPFSQKLANFTQSAEARLMDPEGQKAYVQGLIDKVVGVGLGLNEAKDEVKTTAMIAATKAWTALKDGSVASFLAQPNAINEPLFKTLGTCFDAMRKDPNAVNNVLAIMGRELEVANDKYTKMTPQERGIQDGKAMFWFINPAGSTEAVDLALVRLEPVIAPVDAALVRTIDRSVQAIREIAKTSLEEAQQAKQMFLDFLNGKGLYGRKLAGIPDEFFAGMKPTEPAKINDTVNAMSKADGLGGSERLVSKGVDATGKALRFSEDSGIELGAARLGQDGLWQEVPVVRGNEVHVGLGENLPSGTKTIDRIVFRDGVAESIKSIDPRLDSYKDPTGFRNKLNEYLRKMEFYEGQPNKRAGFKCNEDQIEQKILHLGIPDGSLTVEQVRVLEDIGRSVMKYNAGLPVDKAPLTFKVTVLK
jgi:hypothetical protein